MKRAEDGIRTAWRIPRWILVLVWHCGYVGITVEDHKTPPRLCCMILFSFLHEQEKKREKWKQQIPKKLREISVLRIWHILRYIFLWKYLKKGRERDREDVNGKKLRGSEDHGVVFFSLSIRNLKKIADQDL